MTDALECTKDDKHFPLAETFGFLNAPPGNSSIEIGHQVVFPPFRRTHIMLSNS